MLAFLRAMRRDGKPIRWIAARLGITPGRAAAKAAALRLIVWQPNAKPAADPNELEPLGPLREIAGDGLCRFIAAATDEPWRMCARPCPDGSAWCPYHRARVYVRNEPEPSKKKKLVMAGLDPATQGHSTGTFGLTQSNEATKSRTFRCFVASCEKSSGTDAVTLGGRVKPGHDAIGEGGRVEPGHDANRGDGR